MSFVAAGVGIAGIGVGLYQTLHGQAQAKKAQKALESQRSPAYTPDKAIGDYYVAALNKYNVSPYNSTLYQYSQANIARNAAQGLSSLQDRRQALGGVSAITQGSNDANLKAAVQAENQKMQQFGQLGRAASMENSEKRYGFGINNLLPYNNARALEIAKAQGGNAIENAGLQSIDSGLNNAAMIATSKK